MTMMMKIRTKNHNCFNRLINFLFFLKSFHYLYLLRRYKTKVHQKLLIQLNENDVHMENFVIEKILFIDKKLFILVILIGIIKKMIQIITNLNVHMELIVIEKILIILMNIVIQKNDQK